MATNRRVAVNLFSGVVQNIVRIGIQLVMLPLMARLLGPEELGLYALAMPIMTFVLLLADAGLEDSLAREKSDEHPAWSSAFWGLLVSSLIIAVIVYAVSFAAGAAAGQPRLPVIMLPLATSLIMVALTVIPAARTVRAGKLTHTAAADIVGNLSGAVLAVVLALKGFGVWALVVQFCTLYFVRMVVFNIFFPFAPKLLFSLKALTTHWGIGSAILMSRLIELGGRIGENTLVSRHLGPAALGTYGYANQIAKFVSDSVGNPAFANFYYLLISGKGGAVPPLYLRSIRLLGLILFPVTMILAIVLPGVIPWLLGPKWIPAIAPMMILVLSYPFASMTGLHGAVMLNTGRSHIYVITASLMAALRLAVTFATLPYGIMAIAAGIAAVNVIHHLGIILFVSPLIGNRRRDHFAALIGPIMSAILTGVALYFVLGQSLAPSETPDVPKLLLCGALGVIVYVGALFALDHKHFRADIDLITGLVRKKGSEG